MSRSSRDTKGIPLGTVEWLGADIGAKAPYHRSLRFTFVKRQKRPAALSVCAFARGKRRGGVSDWRTPDGEPVSLDAVASNFTRFTTGSHAPIVKQN